MSFFKFFIRISCIVYVGLFSFHFRNNINKIKYGWMQMDAKMDDDPITVLDAHQISTNKHGQGNVSDNCGLIDYE